MGRQLNLYLDEQEAKRLVEIATRECRRPHQQAKYILRDALGLIPDTIPENANSGAKDFEAKRAAVAA